MSLVDYGFTETLYTKDRDRELKIMQSILPIIN